VIDCPYEAIEMVEYTSKRGETKEVARVISESCVSCGLCSGSCSTYSIGPEGSSGKDQLERSRKFLSSQSSGISSIVVFCEKNGSMKRKIENRDVASFPVPCVGNLHPRIVAQFLGRFEEVVIVTCPERNCVNREGPFLLKERLLQGRSPNENSKMELERLKIWSFSESELSQFLKRSSHSQESNWKSKSLSILKQTLFSAILLFTLAFLSQIKSDENVSYAELRLSFRLPGQKQEVCETRSEEELKKLPRHMRRPQKCEVTLLSYNLRIRIDGEERLTKRINPPGVRGDRPLIVSETFRVEPGRHEFEIDFSPIQEKQVESSLQEDVSDVSAHSSAISLSLSESFDFKVGRVGLVSYKPTEGRLQIRSQHR